MTNQTDSLVLDILKRIQVNIADLRREVAGNSVQIAAMGQQVGALTTAIYSGKSEMEDFKRRLERIERRLDLSDAPPHH